MACNHAPNTWCIYITAVHLVCDIATACASQTATQSNAWGDNMKHLQVGASDIPSINNQQMPPPHHAGHSKPADTPRAAEDEAVSEICSPVPAPVDQPCLRACIPTCICLDIWHHCISLVCMPCHNFIIQTTVIDNTCCQLLACTCKSGQTILHCTWNADLLL